MDFKLETEFSKVDILKEVDALKKQVDDARPLAPDIEGRVMQKLRLDWNYNSNSIEGNKLSYGETIALLMHGVTAKGKPLKDHLDIEGHDDAIDFLLSIVKEKRAFSEIDIRAIHKMLLKEPYKVMAKTPDGRPSSKRIKIGEYKTTPNHVETVTGETHYYASPEETPAKMQELMAWYEEASNNKSVHPIVVAALFHHKFVAIHPFDDGNGRVTRILMNLILMRNNYPPAVIKSDDKQNYYALLSQADIGENLPFIEYISERIESSLNLYLKAIANGDIDEDEDIDKELTLLKIQLKGNVVAKEKVSKSAIERVFIENIFPLSTKIETKLNIFQEFFFRKQSKLIFKYVDPNINNNNQVRSNSIVLGEAYMANYKKIISSTAKVIDIELQLIFSEYKDPENRFSLIASVKFIFEEFYYKTLANGEIIASKLYHENLVPIDQNETVKQLIQSIKNQLNEKIKSPES